MATTARHIKRAGALDAMMHYERKVPVVFVNYATSLDFLTFKTKQRQTAYYCDFDLNITDNACVFTRKPWLTRSRAIKLAYMAQRQTSHRTRIP